MVPPLSTAGLLPPGIHVATEVELRERFGGSGTRDQLIAAVRRAAAALLDAGCSRLWVDGSFVSAKVTPEDWDGCWDTAGVDPRLLDPVLLDFSVVGRARMKTKYLADLFPSMYVEAASTSIFLEYFQVDKHTGQPKGLIQINLGTKP